MNQQWNKIYSVLKACDNKSLWKNSGVKIGWTDLWEELYPILPRDTSYDDIMTWSLQELLNSSIPQSSLLFFEMLVNNNTPNDFYYNNKATMKQWESFVGKMQNKKNIDLAKNILVHSGYDGYSIESIDGIEKPIFNQEPIKKIPLSVKDKFLVYSGLKLPLSLKSARFIVCDETISDYEQVKYLMEFSRDYDCPVLLLAWQIDDIIADMLGRAYGDNYSKVIPLDTLNVEPALRTNLLSDCAWITGSDLVSYVFRNELRTLSRGSKCFSAEFPEVTVGSNYVSLLASSTLKSCRARASELLKRLQYPDEPHDLIRKRAALINGISVSVSVPDNNEYDFDFIDIAISSYKTMMQTGVCDCKSTFGAECVYDYFPAQTARNAIGYAKGVLKVSESYSDITINL